MFSLIEQFIITNLQTLYDAVGWLGVTGLLVFENATGITPSEIILGLAGWMLLAAHDAPLYSIFWWGGISALGSTTGAAITYWVANLGGRPIINRMATFFRINPEHISNAETKFNRWGTSIVFFGRMVPGVRTLINIPAGLARIPFLLFITYTLVGAYLWNTLLIGLGYVLGHEWWQISAMVKSAAPWLLLVAGLVWIGVVIYRKLTGSSINTKTSKRQVDI
jgi:membrane protein DedA with SNARE-associated domain